MARFLERLKTKTGTTSNPEPEPEPQDKGPAPGTGGKVPPGVVKEITKRKRQRRGPTKAELKEQLDQAQAKLQEYEAPATEFDKGMFVEFWKGAFCIAGTIRQRPDVWELSQGEAEALAAPSTEAAKYWLKPEYEKYFALVALGLVAISIGAAKFAAESRTPPPAREPESAQPADTTT